MNIDVQSSHQSVDFRGNFFYKVFCIDVMSKDNPSWKKFKILDSELRNKVGGRYIVRAAYGIGCLRPQPKHADKMFKFWFEIKILRPLNGSNIPQMWHIVCPFVKVGQYLCFASKTNITLPGRTVLRAEISSKCFRALLCKNSHQEFLNFALSSNMYIAIHLMGDLRKVLKIFFWISIFE